MVPTLGNASQHLTDLAVVMGLYRELVQTHQAGERERMAELRYRYELDLERERMRADAAIKEDRERWHHLREEGREARAEAWRAVLAERARADEALEATESTRDELEEQIDQLRARLGQTAQDGPPSALDKLLPAIQAMAPELIPRFLAWLDGSNGRGSLPGDGGGGGNA